PQAVDRGAESEVGRHARRIRVRVPRRQLRDAEHPQRCPGGRKGRRLIVAVKEGWKGRVYEDFEVGDIYVPPLGRTVLSVDNSWFTLLTQNVNPIHFDHAYAAQTEFGRPLVDSPFTLGLVTGQSTIDLSFNVMANLGWDEGRLPNPLFEGDTVYSRSEVLDKRESKSRPNVGIVKVKTTGFKQDGVVVIEFLRTFMVYNRSHLPVRAKMPEPKVEKLKSGKVEK